MPARTFPNGEMFLPAGGAKQGKTARRLQDEGGGPRYAAAKADDERRNLMSRTGQIMEDYFRRTGRPGPMALDAAYQYQVTVLRDLLERLEAVLDDEGVPPETTTRVIRCILYGSPSVADAELRMQQAEQIKDLQYRVPPLPVDIVSLKPKRRP
jgi:hypothetical protein